MSSLCRLVLAALLQRPYYSFDNEWDKNMPIHWYDSLNTAHMPTQRANKAVSVHLENRNVIQKQAAFLGHK